MKKLSYIGMLIGTFILLSSAAKAQYYYTSYGYAQDWYVPKYIQYSVYDHHYGYDIAHVQRYQRHGHLNYNVLLHRNGWFVELRFDHHGHVYKTIRHKWHYPLVAHQCTSYCGYHRNYYKVYYPKYHGHKHHKKVYVGTHYDHKKKDKYYTNVYVEEQQKPHNKYDMRLQEDQHNPQRRTNGAIRIADRTQNWNDVNVRRSGGNTNSSKVQRGNNSERYSRPTTGTKTSGRNIAYQGRRVSRD